ncbi:MAG: NfeD-like protein [Firmicutes bacterium]|nr:NfeD-like protein [Bacillota bacterium]MBR4075041.1 NfeD-like protein [Bacillota bacterium]MBR7149300.1 NfeD-like protein [Bacillota bacterium]
MIAWWDSLDPTVKILYFIAIPSTLVFVIQTVMAFLGGIEGGEGVAYSDTSGLDLDGGFDGPDLSEMPDAMDIDDVHFGDGGNPADFSIMRMFTLQGIITFLMVTGWSAIASISAGAKPSLSIIVGVVLGVVAMYAVAKLIHASRRLTENGTLDVRNAIGANAKVYIPIPEQGHGEGKVTLYVQGRYAECDAVTTEPELLRTGTTVRIVDVRNGVLVVERDEE